jgi:hypothetical protein
VIGGDLQTLQRRLVERDDQKSQRLANAARATSRASVLTHQLPAFSRRQPLEPKSVSVNTLIAGMSDLLRRSLPVGIAVETVAAGGVWPIFVDANQLENSLLDLAVNARGSPKVLFTSGYAQHAIVHHGRLDPGVQLNTRPFTSSALAAKVRGVLDEP